MSKLSVHETEQENENAGNPTLQQEKGKEEEERLVKHGSSSKRINPNKRRQEKPKRAQRRKKNNANKRNTHTQSSGQQVLVRHCDCVDPATKCMEQMWQRHREVA
jgi:hypothetical protein